MEPSYQNKTLDICKLAVSQNPNALEFVDPSLLGNRELALLAVDQDGLSIKLVDEVLHHPQTLHIALNLFIFIPYRFYAPTKRYVWLLFAIMGWR